MEPSLANSLALDIRAVHEDVQQLSCDVVNNRVAAEQAVFNLQDSITHLHTVIAQLQETLQKAEEVAREARYQVAVARLETQQLSHRLSAVEESLNALD